MNGTFYYFAVCVLLGEGILYQGVAVVAASSGHDVQVQPTRSSVTVEVGQTALLLFSISTDVHNAKNLRATVWSEDRESYCETTTPNGVVGCVNMFHNRANMTIWWSEDSLIGGLTFELVNVTNSMSIEAEIRFYGEGYGNARVYVNVTEAKSDPDVENASKLRGTDTTTVCLAVFLTLALVVAVVFSVMWVITKRKYDELKRKCDKYKDDLTTLPSTRVVPLDAPCSGCADICVLEEHNIVLKPEKVSFTEAACALSDGVKAYTALHYLARICAGEIVLIINGADATGTVMIQLALHWGAKVLTTASNEEERTYLEGLRPSPSKVIVVGEKASSLVKSCLEETGGLGVDCIIDNGVSQFESEEDQTLALAVTSQYQPHKHELLSCLGMGGRWVTCQPDLQLDPPDSSLLYLKGASLSFLFTDVWTLASSQQGRFLHILKDVMEKVANKTVRPCFEQPLSLENVPEAYRQTTVHRGRNVMQI